jgi:hypothetical protein
MSKWEVGLYCQLIPDLGEERGKMKDNAGCKNKGICQEFCRSFCKTRAKETGNRVSKACLEAPLMTQECIDQWASVSTRTSEYCASCFYSLNETLKRTIELQDERPSEVVARKIQARVLNEGQKTYYAALS